MNLEKSKRVDNPYISIIRDEIEALREFVQIFKSTTYANPFVRIQEVKNEDGIIERKQVVDEQQMLAVIITGRMIGLDPVTSLGYGNSLDDNAIVKVNLGSKLGLDVVSSLHQIHIFKNKEGKISKVLDTHLIEAILIKNNIWIEFTEYFKPVYRYQSPTGKIYENDEVLDENKELLDSFILINPNKPPTAQEVKVNQQKGLKYVIAHEVDRRTTCKAVRGEITREESVTRQDAIDWGLYPGVTSFGEEREKTGRHAMWVNRLPRMLAKTAMSNVADRIASDLLHGIISDATYSQYDDRDASMEDTPIVDAEIIDTEDIAYETAYEETQKPSSEEEDIS